MLPHNVCSQLKNISSHMATSTTSLEHAPHPSDRRDVIQCKNIPRIFHLVRTPVHLYMMMMKMMIAEVKRDAFFYKLSQRMIVNSFSSTHQQHTPTHWLLRGCALGCGAGRQARLNAFTHTQIHTHQSTVCDHPHTHACIPQGCRANALPIHCSLRTVWIIIKTPVIRMWRESEIEIEIGRAR